MPKTFSCIHCGVSVEWDSLPLYIRKRSNYWCVECCRKYHRESMSALRMDEKQKEKENARARKRYREREHHEI